MGLLLFKIFKFWPKTELQTSRTSRKVKQLANIELFVPPLKLTMIKWNHTIWICVLWGSPVHPISCLLYFAVFWVQHFLRKVPKRTMAVVRFQLRGVLNSNSKSNSCCCCCCFYSQIMYLRKTKAYATYIYPPFDAIILLGRKTHKDKCIK